jgi:hypothetical protein
MTAQVVNRPRKRVNSTDDLAVLDGDLYVSGHFTSADGVAGTEHIARWDGVVWHSVGGGVNDWVYGLGVFAGQLVVGGRFTQAGQIPVNYVAKWDGQTWTPMGIGFTAGEPLPTVWCFAIYNGELIAGGRFSSSGNTSLGRIARWDGSAWQPLGQGLGVPGESVFDLAVYCGDLIAGGQFQTAGGNVAECIAKWDGQDWHSMTPEGMEGSAWNEVAALSMYRDDLVIGGRFTGIIGVPNTSHIARWDGLNWTDLGMGANDLVDDFLPWGEDLIVSGYFTQAGGQSAKGLS